MRRVLQASFLALAALLFGPAAAAQQPAPEQKVIDAPGVPGGKVVISASRDQLRAGPGVKTARLPHAIRAAMTASEKAVTPPAYWEWTNKKDGSMVKLPMYGNDQYGDCYYVTLLKLFILYQWQRDGTQLTFDQQQAIKRYLQLSGGDNGLSDDQVFPELLHGVIGPSGPHKAQDKLIIPATDQAALDLTGWAFGPHMFTFTVYSNFSQGVKPDVLFTSSSGSVLGGHAIPMSGRTKEGYRRGETWAIQPGFRASPAWIASVDPEFVAVFSNEWFDAKGYAPNGLHYQVLAGLWNGMGGHVDPVGPFPAPATANPTATLTAAGPATGSYTLTWATTNATAVTLNGDKVDASGTKQVVVTSATTFTLVATGAAGTIPATATVTVGGVKPPDPPQPQPGTLVPYTGAAQFKDGMLMLPPVPAKLTRADVEARVRRGFGTNIPAFMEPLIQSVTDEVMRESAPAAPAAPAPKSVPATPKRLSIDGVPHEQGADGVYRKVAPVLKP